ncbi:hypothetical protein CRM22_008845 [Opisthorchis felineus]|uniref:Centriolar satellite-associated tubulin polyglutamylase complex regulator 1 n=1 Tax=Opisthorchis felineus TaxID=147828 RepID=A0A4S2L9C2_OPIFE|nr:hypothetical protein CRM22_008845 [Opisthorchis felineus]
MEQLPEGLQYSGTCHSILDRHIAYHDIKPYLQDALNQLLLAHDMNFHVDTRTFLANYFRLVKKGTHTVFREYDYVVLTNHNRISFLSSIRKFYQPLRHQDVTADEFFSLLRLLCPDFPRFLVIRAFKTIRTRETETQHCAFHHLLTALAFHVYFEKFVSSLFSKLSNVMTRVEDLSTPPTAYCSNQCCSAGTQTMFTEPLSPSLDNPSDGMFETEKFKQAISDLCADQGCAFPSQCLVRSCALRLFKEPNVNVYRFFKTLIGERTLWTEIGIL